MRVRLRPGLRALWRDGQTLQFGWGTRPALIYRDPGKDDLRILQNLLFLGATHDRGNRLLRSLYDANLLITKTQALLPNIKHEARLRLADDSFIWSVRSGSETGWQDLESRASARVLVRGLGRTGSQLVQLLAHCGVGEIHMWDPAPVSHGDVSPGGYELAHAGERRDLLLQQIISDRYPDVSVQVGLKSRVDLAILIGHYVINPAHYADLIRDDTAHLAVIFNDFGASLGPLTVPGSSPCLRCIDLHHVDGDPAWPALATQLGNLGVEELPPEESGISNLAAALAVNMVVRALGSEGPKPVNSTLEFSIDEYVPAAREWSAHPDCGCAATP